MHFPLHVHGTTLFPRASYIEDCWRGAIHVVSGRGDIRVHRCVGGHPAEAIALAFARIEMRALARSLAEACEHRVRP